MISQEQNQESWTDIIDQVKYNQTGVALLYRNPRIKSTLNSTKYDPTNHIYSIDPGENCIFNQKPVALGFTAYIGHEEIKSGENSLRSNLRSGKLGFQTIDYYRNYSTKLFEKYSINDKKKARPKTEIRLQIDFYTEFLSNEQKFYEESERFFSESQNEEDHAEKANLREYVEAFFEWIEDRLIDLNPNENHIKGLGGLREVEAEYIYKEFIGNYIHSKTKKEHFIAIFQNRILPDGWKRVEWLGKKSLLFTFIDQIFSTKIKPSIIKKYFLVKNDYLLAKNRTVNLDPGIQKLLKYSKTLKNR